MREAVTKAKTTEALLTLMINDKITDITVTKLAAAAKISRASFYRFYNNIDEVIDDLVELILNNFVEKYLPYLNEDNKETFLELTTSFFVAAKKRKVKLFQILPENLSYIISKTDTYAWPYKESTNKYIPGLLLAAVNQITRTWVKQNYDDTPEELAKFVYNLFGEACWKMNR